jgi:hypothetical protein
MHSVKKGGVTTLAVLLLLASAFTAQAACDPGTILRHNVSKYNENIAVFLAFVKNLQRIADQAENSTVALSYDGVGLSLADAGALAENIMQNENYRINEEQSIAVLRATLSLNDLKAYFACVASRDPVDIILPVAALVEPTFHFRVAWDPEYPAKKSTLSLHIANGTIGGQASVSVSMDSQDILDFEVKRDGDGSKPLSISAYMYGKPSDPVSLPGIAAFTLALKAKSSNGDHIKRSSHDGIDYVKHYLCIYPDGDAILLPSTMKFSASALVGDPARARAGVYDKQNTVWQSCGYIENSAGGNEDYSEIGGQFLVFETALEPATGGARLERVDMSKKPSRYQDIDAILQEAGED